jgi:hypothetical protein
MDPLLTAAYIAVSLLAISATTYSVYRLLKRDRILWHTVEPEGDSKKLLLDLVAVMEPKVQQFLSSNSEDVTIQVTGGDAPDPRHEAIFTLQRGDKYDKLTLDLKRTNQTVRDLV